MDVSQTEMQSMKEIVDKLVGIPLFTYEMQLNAPRPEGNYAAIKCVSSTNPGYDETKIVTVDGDDFFQTKGIRILTFYVLFSRMGDEYIKFDNSFILPECIALMKSKKFAALGKQALTLATIQLETNWEVRQGISVQVNVLREQSVPVGTMSYANVGSEFYDGNSIITSTIKGI